MTIKIPSWEDYIAYDGEHCSYKWRQLDDNWRCPGCSRTKFELLRWTLKDKRNNPHWGWKAALHAHHDHSRIHGIERFIETIICDHCNAVDDKVRRHFKGLIDPSFSFSPDEIRQIIKARPHCSHEIDFDIAWDIYAKLKSQ